MIGTDGTSGCEASAPRRLGINGLQPKGILRASGLPSAPRAPTPTPSHGLARVWLGLVSSPWAVSTWAGRTCLETPMRVPVLAPPFSATADAPEQPAGMDAGLDSHCSGMAG